MKKALVTFTYGEVQVSITVRHDAGLTEDAIIKTAQEDLTFNHDIDVVHLGDWTPKVTPVEESGG